MYFLIDYENVSYAGLEGTQFLEEDDCVCFFFGKETDKIVYYRMKLIEESGCELEIVKRVNVRKNALDFYIASKVGEIFAVNPNAQVAIISKDHDHLSVCDYWGSRLKNSRQLVVEKNIADAIKSISGEQRRKTIVNERMKAVSLENTYKIYEERRRFAAEVRAKFLGTEFEQLVPQIIDIARNNREPKILYLSSLKKFGKKNGTEVYRKIKECTLTG